MSGLSTTAAEPPPRTALRVCWQGDNPKRGDRLTSAAGRETYNVCSVTVLHRAELSPKPRLLLSVTRGGCLALPSGCIVHGWERTAAPVRPERPANDVSPASVAVTPLPSADHLSRQARERRIASEQATPAKAQASVWDDPADSVQTKTPRQTRGYRRQDVLGHMARSGCDVTKDMLIASRMFQVDVDVSRLGFSSGGDLADRVGCSPPGPSLGPSKACEARAAKQREVARVIKCLGQAAAKMVVFVSIHNYDIAAWCRLHSGNKLERRKEMGKMLGAFQHLSEIYGVDSERDRIRSLKARTR